MIHMNCLVKARAKVKYSHEKTNATIRTKANNTTVFVLRLKSFPALYMPPPLKPLFSAYPFNERPETATKPKKVMTS